MSTSATNAARATTRAAWSVARDNAIPLPKACPATLKASVRALDDAAREAALREDGAALAAYLRNQAAACLEAWSDGEIAVTNTAQILNVLTRLVHPAHA